MSECPKCENGLLGLAFKRSDIFEYINLPYCPYCEIVFTKKLLEVKI